MSDPHPIDFRPSTSTPSSFTDVVTSYRRAQTFLSGSNITFHDAFPIHRRWDEEYSAAQEFEESDEIEATSTHQDIDPTPHANDPLDPLWDDEVQPLGWKASCLGPNERTPLLVNRQLSLHDHSPPEARPECRNPVPLRKLSTRSINERNSPVTLGRSSRDLKYHSGGNSTYRQTLFNSIAILLGIGVLSEPLAFAYAGWITGSVLIVFYGFITCYTAKTLAKIIAADPTLRTYADIGFKAFGPRSIVLTGLLFCLEIFSVSVVLLTLYADSLHLVLPIFSANKYKILGLLVIIPTIFMPLSVLSYASILGILSTTLVIACIIIDGLTRHEAPGSLWQPANTDWEVKDMRRLGVAFGLFMAGFGGHAVIPSLARDMEDPTRFDQMINWAFGIATVIYGIIGANGYLMYGSTVSEEISKDILTTPGYNVFLNKLTVWMLVIAPLSKFALSTRPLNLTLEIWLGINTPSIPSSSRPASPTTKSATTLATSPRTTKHPMLLIVERITVTFVAAIVSILVPQFSTVMAFIGSFSAFVLCVIGPICAKIAIQRRCSWYDGILLVVSAIFAVWGTIAAFL